MKILISTLKPSNNYGQILQAFASQEFFKSLDHEVYIFFHTKVTLKSLLRRLINTFLFFGDFKGIKKSIKKEKLLKPFISNQIHRLEEKDLARCIKKNQIDCLVIGSDQVWREEYIREYPEFYLPKDKICKKIISIAASTGKRVDLNSTFYKKYFQRLNNFDLISCREDKTKVDIEKCFGFKAFHICDPTQLLLPSHYIEISSKSHLRKELQTKNYILLYGLDLGIDDKTIHDLKISSKMEIILIEHNRDSIEDFLAKFELASFVITDSFHGLQFSCIFNKKFAIKKNHKRGSLRFDSFLTKINMERSTYSNSDELIELITGSVKYNYRDKLDIFINESKNILKKSL